MNNSKVQFSLIPILLFFSSFLHVVLSTVPAQGSSLVQVQGIVLDGATLQPLPNAHVVFWSVERGSFVAETNESGLYGVEVSSAGSYQVFAHCDRTDTPGIDYVPCRRRVSLEGGVVDISFTLLQGASIRVDGEFRHFESLEPVEVVVFTVHDQDELAGQGEALKYYGASFITSNILKLDGRTVIAPSDALVKVEADTYFQDGSERRLIIDDNGGYLSLTQGEHLVRNLRNLYLKSEIESGPIYEWLGSVKEILEENNRIGFYVSYEETRLIQVENLLRAGRSALLEEDYDSVYADLRESYLIMKDVEESLLNMRTNASLAVFFITPFLAFTAIAFSSVLFDDRRRRVTVSLIVYMFLFMLLYFFYPGYIMLQETILSPLMGPLSEGPLIMILAVFSFPSAYFSVYVLPWFFRDNRSNWGLCLIGAVSAAFSISARNLRRRKLRSLLASIFLLTAVFAFITLTCFSFESGLAIQPVSWRPAPPSDGVLVRKPTGRELRPYNPLEPAILGWLEERKDVAVVAPKVENIPELIRIGTLENPVLGLDYTVQGVIGVLPSREVDITKIGEILLEGVFMRNDDLCGILISVDASEALKMGLNETLRAFGEKFTVTGIFDGKLLEGLKELDGTSLVPIYLQPITADEILPVQCSGGKVVIMQWEAASKLNNTILSRIAVHTSEVRDIEQLARLTVLIWPNLKSFTSLNGRITEFFIGPYYKISGFASLTVPMILVVLNIGMMMLGSVYERRREVSILSTVGLSPFHIVAVFIAEAVTIGVIAGSSGYILGLMSYRFMAFFGVPFGVKFKTEAGWCILALCFSIAAAVLASALPASKASTIVTPSTLKKWRIEKQPRDPEGPWLLNIPLRLPREGLEDFISFIYDRLQSYAEGLSERVENLKVSRMELRPETCHLRFEYVRREKNILTHNDLTFTETDNPNVYDVLLISKTRLGKTTPRDRYQVYQTASFIRRSMLEYSAKSKSPTRKQTP